MRSSDRVASMSALLRAAERGDTQAQARYSVDARAATLAAAGWGADEKVAHYLEALDERPDSLHFIDRLATALEETASAGGVVGGTISCCAALGGAIGAGSGVGTGA